MKRKLLFIITIITNLSLVACGQTVSADVVKSDKPRITNPDSTEAELKTLVNGNSAFAFDLYQPLRTGLKGFFILLFCNNTTGHTISQEK